MFKEYESTKLNHKIEQNEHLKNKNNFMFILYKKNAELRPI